MATSNAGSDEVTAATHFDGGAAVEAAYRNCKAATKRSTSNFYYAFRILPLAKRRAIYTTYAFCRLCDDIVDDGELKAKEAAGQLEAVRLALDEAYEGRPEGDLWVALNDSAQRFNIPRRYFHDIIDGVEMDLTLSRYPTFSDLKQYCARVASAVGLICIQVCGYRDERAIDHAVDLGIAMQLTNILRDIAEDAERGRIYIPQEDMARFGCSEIDLIEGRATDNVEALLRFEAARARDYFDSGELLFQYLDARCRACTSSMHAVYSTLLDRVESAGGLVFDKRVRLGNLTRLAIVARQWLLSFLPGRA